MGVLAATLRIRALISETQLNGIELARPSVSESVTRSVELRRSVSESESERVELREIKSLRNDVSDVSEVERSSNQ